MLYHAGNMTIALTSVSPQPRMGEMKGEKVRKAKPVVPVKAMVAVWRCPVCGANMPLNDLSKRPKRCSNRQTCGVMFSKV